MGGFVAVSFGGRGSLPPDTSQQLGVGSSLGWGAARGGEQLESLGVVETQGLREMQGEGCPPRGNDKRVGG